MVADFGFKSGTRIIKLLVSLLIPKFASWCAARVCELGIGTLAISDVFRGPAAGNSPPKLCSNLRSRFAVDILNSCPDTRLGEAPCQFSKEIELKLEIPPANLPR